MEKIEGNKVIEKGYTFSKVFWLIVVFLLMRMCSPGRTSTDLEAFYCLRRCCYYLSSEGPLMMMDGTNGESQQIPST